MKPKMDKQVSSKGGYKQPLLLPSKPSWVCICVRVCMHTHTLVMKALGFIHARQTLYQKNQKTSPFSILCNAGD